LLQFRIRGSETGPLAEVDFVDLNIYNGDFAKVLREIAQSKILFDYDINELKK
jgi:hypothetical protein